MKKRLFGFCLLGLIAYLIFLLASLPAARAWAWFGNRAPVNAYGLGGTVWSGQAAVVQDQLRRLEAVRWQLHPTRLLLGRINADVHGRLPAEGQLRGEFSVGRDELRARDLQFDLPAKVLMQWATIQLPVAIDGRIDSVLRDLLVRDGALLRADGIINWDQASIELGRQPLPLGKLSLRLSSVENAIHGVLENQGSPLELSGELQLTPDGKFVLDLRARLADGADEAARSPFTSVGVPADGTPVEARLSGALDGSGVRLEALNR